MRAASSAIQLMDRLEDELSRFRPDSDVSFLNELGAHRAVPVSRALFEILVLAKAAWEETGGAFDPTVGPLMDAWGFPRGPARIPADEEIQELLSRKGMDHLILDPEAHTARYDREGMAIDLGGIGKGYTLDRVVSLLQERGVPAGAVISGTSSIVLWGSPPEGNAWRIQVTHPEKPDAAVRILEVEPGSISTSGAYRDRFVHEGIEYGHILDPRTGKPVERPIESVTVWTPEAVQGDILSTALFVLDPEAGKRLLERRPRVSALLVEKAPEGSQASKGLSVRAVHSGPPAFQEIEEP